MPLRRRKREAAPRPWLTRDDAAFAAELPVLAVLAFSVPERSWRAACRRLEDVKARLKLFDPGPVANTVQRVFGAGKSMFDAKGFALDSAAGRSEHHIQILRASLLRWMPQLRLEGRDHLDAALASTRGAVLWVAHFRFNALATKQALAAAAQRFADRLDGWVRRYPEQWRDWKNLKLPSPDSAA